MSQEEYNKVHRKIPQWFRKTSQINSQILIGYLELTNGHNLPVSTIELGKHCANVRTFTENLNQMKIITDKNHAKVFDEENGTLTLWEPVACFILDEYKKTR